MGGKKRHNYKNLKIWLLGIEIAKDISDVLINFPKHEQYDLSSQMNRSSISIPSNIAEGSSRTEKSFKHFIDKSKCFRYSEKIKHAVLASGYWETKSIK